MTKTNSKDGDIEYADSNLFNKKIGSDYYAANEEDPLVGSKSFKKKKNLTSQKRKRDEDDGDDIVAMLEGQSSNQLATKSQLRETVQKSQKNAEKIEKQKAKNYENAFDRVKKRNKAKQNAKENALDLIDLDIEEFENEQEEDYA